MGTVVGQADPANQNNLLVVETEQRSCEDSSIRPNSSEGSSLDGYGDMEPGESMGTHRDFSVSESRHLDESEMALPKHWRTIRTRPYWHNQVVPGIELLLLCDRRCWIWLREEVNGE